jgi:hypothetical protein
MKLSAVLFAVAVVFAVLAAATLIPFSSSMISDLGYHALCSYAPWSTLVLLLLGGGAWVVRGYLEGD